MAEASTELSVRERVALIVAECQTPLGFAQRGVTSWEQDWLLDWAQRSYLSPADEHRLQVIERQVFGRYAYG